MLQRIEAPMLKFKYTPTAGKRTSYQYFDMIPQKS
jgi:hypothetical protein